LQHLEKTDFYRGLQYCASPDVSFKNFSKKNRPHDWSLLPTVEIAAQNIEICGFAGGENFRPFLDLGVSRTP
jgi:hypothetical protein